MGRPMRIDSLMSIAVRVARAGALYMGLAVTVFCGVSNARAALPIQAWHTASGAKVLFVQSDAIPMLDVRIEFDAGSRFDPTGKAGLAALTADMLDTGAEAAGAQAALSESQIADRFADIGAQQSILAGRDYATVSLRTLVTVDALRRATDTLAQCLQHPSFPEAVLTREKGRLIAGIQEADTKPEVTAQKALWRSMYAAHPYGVTASPRSVAAIDRKDIVGFYRNAYSARRAVIAMVGAITRDQAEQIATQLSAGLPPGGVLPDLPPVSPLSAALSIDLPHPAEQAHILIGQPAIARNDPDYFPLLVGNYILGGGGFVSRLTQEVREQRGLTYGVTSQFMPLRQAGPFVIGLQTRRDRAAQALQVVRATLDRFIQEGPSAAELQAAKDNLVNGFALRIDSNRKLIANVAAIGFYDLPLDYLDTWTQRVKQVTLADIRQAFARHLDPARMATVVVGPTNVAASAKSQ